MELKIQTLSTMQIMVEMDFLLLAHIFVLEELYQDLHIIIMRGHGTV